MQVHVCGDSACAVRGCAQLTPTHAAAAAATICSLPTCNFACCSHSSSCPHCALQRLFAMKLCTQLLYNCTHALLRIPVCICTCMFNIHRYVSKRGMPS